MSLFADYLGYLPALVKVGLPGRPLAGGGQEARRSCENFSYSLFQPSLNV
jgi:hypothetical protein